MTAPSRGVGRGAALGVVATGLDRVAALGIALWLPRHLGLDDYGRYALVITLLAFFQTLPDASLENVLVARIARDAAAGPGLAGAAAPLRAAVSLACGVAAPALTTLLGPTFAAAAPVLRVLAAVALLAGSGQVLTALLVAEGRERLLLVATSASAVLIVILGVALVPPFGPVGAAAAAALGMLGGQLALVVLAETRPAALDVLRAMGRPLALDWPIPLGPMLLVVAYGAAVVLTRTASWPDVVRWAG